VIASPLLSRNKLSALLPAGTDEGTPTARITSSSTPAPALPPDVNLRIF
jgi:hypothetical protein